MPGTNIAAAELETLMRLLTAQEHARFGIGQNNPAYHDNRNGEAARALKGNFAFVIRVLCAALIRAITQDVT